MCKNRENNGNEKYSIYDSQWRNMALVIENAGNIQWAKLEMFLSIKMRFLLSLYPKYTNDSPNSWATQIQFERTGKEQRSTWNEF